MDGERTRLIAMIETKLEDECKSPLVYDSDVAPTGKLARFIFKNGFQTCAINKRLAEFCAMRENDLFTLDVKPEVAEEKVQELLMIHLYIQQNNGMLEECSDLLKIAIAICIQHKIPNDEYVSYAVWACRRLDQISNHTQDDTTHCTFNITQMLDELTRYRTATDTQDVQYLLHRIRNYRVRLTLGCRFYTDDAAQLANEPKEIDLPETKTLPLIDLPYFTQQASDPEYSACYETALKTVTGTVGASPDVVLLMLRYGATPRHPFSGQLLSQRPPGEFVCRCITRLLKESFMEQPIRETFVAVTENNQIQKLFKMIQYMLRADPYFTVTYISMCSWNDGLNEEGCREIQPSTLKQEPHGIQPTIDSRLRDHFLPPCLTESVPSLFRLSRYVIRGVLLQNRQLPDGIDLLQIDERLKPHLDLLEDY